jgi:flagellar basal body rod protein FlgG
MIRGGYTSVAGLVAAQQRMDVLSNDIANVSTTGFKELLATQGGTGFDVGIAFGDGAGWAAIGPLTTGTMASGLTINRAQGPLLQTGTPTDLAISGDGLFVVGTPTGPAYTRAGDLVLDVNGTLTTQTGLPVLDTTGRPIVVPGGPGAFAVARDGTVDGTGQRIALVRFPGSGITRLGENLYALSGPVTPVADGEGRIEQGLLEGSNVDMGTAMTELIAVQRSFQLASRSLVIQDESLAEANRLGQLRA